MDVAVDDESPLETYQWSRLLMPYSVMK